MKKILIVVFFSIFSVQPIFGQKRVKLDYRRDDRDNFYGEKFSFDNPFRTRYLASQSAFNLKSGETHYQNTYFLINSFEVGVTDNFSISGGVELISLFNFIGSGNKDAETPIFFISPKLGTRVTTNLYMSTGFTYLSFPLIEENMGYGFVNSTFGNQDRNITAGLGYGFFGTELSDKPIILISGMYRISERVALLADNWLMPFYYSKSYYPILSYGVRLFGENIAFDAAFINTSDLAEELFPLGIPYLRCTVKLN